MSLLGTLGISTSSLDVKASAAIAILFRMFHFELLASLDDADGTLYICKPLQARVTTHP